MNPRKHENPPATPANRSVADLTDHLFRQESGKLVSILTGIFGIRRLQLVEDVVQEALVRALQTWPYYGIPENPPAWLMRTARNLAVDLIRRENLFCEKQPEIVKFLEQRMPDSAEAAPMFEDEIKDDRLRLMFACCHPVLPQEAQTALALKTLCSLGPGEIAKGFLTTEAAIAKRLTRARKRLQEEGIAFEIPAGEELRARLDGVLRILYLLFNEGYKASSGGEIVRAGLCAEAIRLTSLLAGHPAGNLPRVHALLALMLLNGARLAARADDAGNILRLGEQDRTCWNHGMIRRGMLHLGHSADGDELSEYHLQAAIAACHATAADDASTDWPRILSLYDLLAAIESSPVVALNRAVAVAKVRGPEAGIRAIGEISGRGQLESYHLLHAVLGDFEEQRSRPAEAAAHFRRALDLTDLKPERAFLRVRIRECEEMISRKPPAGVPRHPARSSSS